MDSIELDLDIPIETVYSEQIGSILMPITQSLNSRLTPDRRAKLRTALRLSLLIFLICGIITFLGFFFGSTSFQQQATIAFNWLSNLSKWASSAILIVVYAISLLFFCPGTPFNLVAGFLYGIYLGSLVSILGCSLGALIAFILGRTIARGTHPFSHRKNG